MATDQVKLFISGFGKDCLHVYGLLVFGDKKIELTRRLTEEDFATGSFEGYKKGERTIRFWRTDDVVAQAHKYCKHLFKEYELEVVYDN